MKHLTPPGSPHREPGYVPMGIKPQKTPFPGEAKAETPSLTGNPLLHKLMHWLQGNAFIKLIVFGKHQKHRISQTDTGRKNHGSIQKQHTEETSESTRMHAAAGATGGHTELPHTRQNVQHGSDCLPTKDTKNQVKDEK